jgi:hypothetical protein
MGPMCKWHRYPVVQDAERGIQQYFMDWIGKPRVEKMVVPTKAGPVVQMTESKVKRIGDDLVGMKDGQAITRSDYWDRKFQYPGFSFGIETFTEALSWPSCCRTWGMG